MHVSSENRERYNDSTPPNGIRNWRPSRRLVVIVALVLGLGLAGGVSYWIYDAFFASHVVSLKVQDRNWERQIEIQQYDNHAATGWVVPSSDNVRNNVHVTGHRIAVRGYRRVVDHYVTLSKQVKVGQKKTGSYTSSYNCGSLKKPKTCSKTTSTYAPVYKTVYYKSPVYRSVPIYGILYSYAWQEWDFNHFVTATGHNNTPTWPTPDNHGTNQRVGAHIASYGVTLTDPSGRNIHEVVNATVWSSLRVGQLLNGEETNSGRLTSVSYPTKW